MKQGDVFFYVLFISQASFPVLGYVYDMTSILNSLIAILPFILLVPAVSTGDFFSPTERSVTNRYRGVFALIVILHHMAQRVTSKGLLWIWFDTGFLPVAMFFFYSGYGLMKKGIRQKEGFFQRRLIPLLIPYLVTMGLYCIFYALAGQVKSLPSLLLEHFNNASGISFLWFVFVYLAWILFLGIALRFIKEDRQILTAGFSFAAFFMAFSILAIPGFFWIYDTVFMIPAGCAWAYYEESIETWIHQHYKKVLISSVLVFAVSMAGHMIPILRVPSYMLSAVSFLFFLNTYTMKRRPDGIVLSYLGTISYEIYLLHGIPVTFLKEAMGNEALWTLSVVVIAVISAYIMHAVAKRTWKPARKKHIDQSA